MPGRYISQELADTVDGLSAETRYSKLVESFAQPEPPPIPEPPRLDFTGALAPLRESAQAAIDSVQQTASGFGQQISGALDGFRQAAIGGMGSGESAPDDIEGYIRHAAQARGINPDIAVRVAMSEGGVSDPVRQSEVVKNGRREESYGPFQLYLGGGLGNAALKQGIDPRNPNQWKQGVDFALDEAAKGGWGPWYGSARAGIAPRAGLENARAIGVSSGNAVPATARPGASAGTASTSDGYHPVVLGAGDNSYWTSGGTHGGSPAADIFAPIGTPIHAPVGGTIRPMSAKLGGNAAILEGDDGRSYYMAHGNVPFASGRVERGSVIGQVGDTGNAKGTSPHLHMGISSKGAGLFDQRNGSGDVMGDASWWGGKGATQTAQHDDHDHAPQATIKGLPAQAALSQYGTMAYAAGGPPVRDDWRTDGRGDQSLGDSATGGRSGTADGGDLLGAGKARGAPMVSSAPSPPIRDIRGDYAPSARHGGIEPGDYELPGGATTPQLGPSVPYGVVGNVEPGDFALPVTQTTTPPPPGGAVEPAGVASTEAAPASSGNPIVDLFSEMGRKLSGILQPQKPDWQQGIQDVQGRATTEPTGPLPFDQIRQDIGQAAQQPSPTERIGEAVYDSPPMQAGRAFAEGSQQEMARYLELNGRMLQGETLTPEEEQEMARAAINVVGDVGGLGNVGPRSVPGVIARPVRQAASAAGNAPSAGIVSRASAAGGDEAARMVPEGGAVNIDELKQIVEQHPSTQRVLDAIERKDWEFTNRPEWRRSEPQLYVRYGNRDPMTERASRNYQTGEQLSGLSANPLVPETYYPTNGRTVGDYVDMQVSDYRYMQGQGAEGTRPWVFEGVEIGRGPDNEPIVKPLRTLGELKEKPPDVLSNTSGVVGRSNAPGVFSGNPVTPPLTPSRAPSSAGATGVRAIGSAAGAGYQESQQEGATPESVLRAGAGAAATSLGRSALGSRAGIRAAGNVARAVQQQGAPPVGEVFRDMPAGPSASFGENAEKMRTMFVRAWTDRGVDLGKLQAQAKRVLKRDLTADEMVVESASHNSALAAKVRRDEQLLPVLQEVGEENKPLLSEALMYRNNIDVAKALGVGDKRKFSFDLTASESQQRLNDLYASMTPEQANIVDEGIAGVQKFVQGIREDLKRAGVWNQELFDDLTAKYPNWTPTRILEYMTDETAQRGLANGKSVSLRDRGLRQYTLEGTEAAREDPLASLYRYGIEAEATIMRNETFNRFVNLADAVPSVIPLKQVPSTYTKKANEGIVTGFKDGKRATYVVEGEPLAAAIKMASDGALPWYFTALPSLARNMITSTPAFVAGQIPLDSFTNLIRTSARMGGPKNAPMVAAEILKGYANAFEGITSGTYKGDLARFMQAGSGMYGFHDRSVKAMRTAVDDMTKKSFMEINGAKGLERLIFQQLGGMGVGAAYGAVQPAETHEERSQNTAKGALAGLGIATSYKFTPVIGHRIEMGNRVAAGRLGERKALAEGADRATALMRGVSDFRSSTLDFEMGGVWAKAINQVVPFFNVGWQSSATIARAIKENPKAFPLTAATLIGTPTIAAEAWNRMDEQRAKDYADVPNYIKDRGIVFMLPGEALIDDKGNRKPSYVLIPMREFAPVALMTRELLEQGLAVAGNDTADPRGWGAVLGAAIGAASPIQATNPSDLAGNVIPPGIGTALQLSQNRDYFRDRDIATDYNDEQASAISKQLAPVISQALGKSVRPSQVEFFIRDVAGNQGAMALGAGDIAAGVPPDSSSVQDMPVIGGVARRFVGSSIGQGLQDARDEMLSPSTKQAIKDAGMRDEQVTAVQGEIQGLKLTRPEQAQYQQAFNELFNASVERYMAHPRWEAASPTAKEQAIRQAATDARAAARGRVVKENKAEMKERARDQRVPAGVR